MPLLSLLSSELLLHLLSFFEASDLLCLARLNRQFHRLVCIHATKLRQFHRIEIFILLDRQFFLHFRDDTGHRIEESANLEILEGKLTAKDWRDNSEKLRISVFDLALEGHFTVGSMNVGHSKTKNFREDAVFVFRLLEHQKCAFYHNLKTLFALAFRHFKPSEFRTNISASRFLQIASLVPQSVTALDYFHDPLKVSTGFDCRAFSNVLGKAPHIRDVILNLPSSVDSAFYSYTAVQNLFGFNLRVSNDKKESTSISDQLLFLQKWKKFRFALSGITVAGLRKLLAEWSRGERELVAFTVYFKEAVELGDLTGELNSESALESGKSLKLTRQNDGQVLYLIVTRDDENDLYRVSLTHLFIGRVHVLLF